MSRLFLNDERGAVTVDWIVLAAGIMFLAMFVVFSVMENSAGYLIDEFERLNHEYEILAVEVSALSNRPDTSQLPAFDSEMSITPPPEQHSATRPPEQVPPR